MGQSDRCRHPFPEGSRNRARSQDYCRSEWREALTLWSRIQWTRTRWDDKGKSSLVRFSLFQKASFQHADQDYRMFRIVESLRQFRGIGIEQRESRSQSRRKENYREKLFSSQGEKHNLVHRDGIVTLLRSPICATKLLKNLDAKLIKKFE